MVGESAHGNIFIISLLITSAYFSCSAFLFIAPVRRVLIKVVEGVLERETTPAARYPSRSSMAAASF